jgi:hypothetical protein
MAMYIDMQCACGAAFVIQDGPDSLSMLYAERFTAAHLACGYMNNVKRDDEELPRYNNDRDKREREH